MTERYLFVSGMLSAFLRRNRSPPQRTTTATDPHALVAVTSPAHPRLSLLGLPTELRLIIYEHFDTIKYKTVHLKGGCDMTICLSFQSPPTALLGVCKQMRYKFLSLFDRLVLAYTPTAVVTANDDNEASLVAVLMALEYLAELFEDYRWDPYVLVRLSH